MMKKPIHVLIIGMSDITGGVETLLFSIFKNIDRETIRFDFMTFSQKCAFEDELVAGGAEVFHITRRRESPSRHKQELIDFFKSHPTDYDYVWFHLCSASNSLPIVLAKKYTNAITVCHSHCTSFDSNPILRPVHMLLGKLNEPKFFASTDVCYGCSKAAWDYLFKGSGKPVHLLDNGIDLNKFKFKPEIRESLRKEMHISPETTVIGHAGRFCATKNQSFLIDIFKAFHDKHCDSVLLLAGTGETLEEMKQKAVDLGLQDAIQFLGFRSDFNDLLQAFDLFLMPSLFEGLPITAVEAQTAGVPCLLADTITSETAITDIVQFASLEQPISSWVDSMENLLSMHQDRISYVLKVKEAGYDFMDTVKNVTDFFTSAQ